MLLLRTLAITASLWGVALAQTNVVAGSAVIPDTPSGPQSLRDLIVNHAELKSFRLALDAAGLLETLLDDETRNITVFAPNNDAMDADGHMVLVRKGMDETPPRWSGHLKAALYNHFVNETYTESAIFDMTRTEIQSMQDSIVISQWSRQVGLASVVTPDLLATNGILHIVKKVIKPEFFDNSFARLELQEENGPDIENRTSMVDVVDFVDGRPTLQTVRDTGTTYAGCRIRAFNRMGLDYLPQAINDAKNVKYGELLNESFTDETLHNFVEYQLIPRNLYLDLIPNGFQELVTPVAGCGHMWVTKSSGRLCFNDGCVVSTPDPRWYLSSNGVGYILDKCPICPGIAMLANYAAEFTNHGLRDVSQLFVGSEWNLRNMSMSVGAGGPLTLFAPTNTGFDFFTLDDTTRLATDKWKRHLWDLLKHFLVDGELTKEDLKTRVQTQGKFNMTMLTGEPVLFDYDVDRNVVLVEGGDLYFPDVLGVDGYVCLWSHSRYWLS
jgi:uncharacterized surface protein with fasciclin (FAS1) repeats